MHSNTLPPRLLNEADTAVYLGLSRGYLRKARMVGTASGTPGPPFVKIGTAIRYDLADLDAWIAKQKHGNR